MSTQAVELSAFARLMRAHTVLRRELEAEVLSPRGLTINDFEALHHLAKADENRLRRVDLVELLMLTPSGVTRLLDGLQEAGLVENVHCEDDARVTWARLTADGIETVQCVGASHAKRLRVALPRHDERGRSRAALGAARQAARRRRRFLRGVG